MFVFHGVTGSPDSLVCFIGTDGSGKTTLAKKFVTDMQNRGAAVRYVWFRSPHFLTLIVFAVARLLGYTKRVSHGPEMIAQHNFDREPFRSLYPPIVLSDTLIQYVFRLWLPTKLGFVLICDRFVHDIIVDISVDIGDESFGMSQVGRLLESLANRAALVVFVDAPASILDIRRPSSSVDPSTLRRRYLYRSLAKRLDLPSLLTGNSLDVTYQTLTEILRRGPTLLQDSRKVYAKTKNLWLRSVLRWRCFAIAGNWFFQGTLMMTMSERVFRLLFELCVLGAALAILSAFFTPVESAILSVLAAHTINWALNGNFWATQKFFRRTYPRSDMIEFLKSLRDSAQVPNCVAAIIVFGSLSRGEFTESSDLDMRIVRKDGCLSWLKANLFATRLRCTCFLKGLPLDLFMLDNVAQVREGLTRISRDEVPVVVYDPGKVFGQSNSILAAGSLSNETA